MLNNMLIFVLIKIYVAFFIIIFQNQMDNCYVKKA